MPFCTQCGVSIGERDSFCAACGARQTASATPPQSDFLGNIDSRTVSLLCYIPLLGWIPSIVVLASAKFQSDRNARFHAFQGLYLFIGWLIADWVLKPIVRTFGFPMGFLPLVATVKTAIFLAWIWMLVKVSQNQSYRLPILGELAERSVAEQR
ncbi:MAG: DUF4870 domain-containing protein [Bryobacterales bacterium]|nr:DUF4870 domain-containing protein [Bryobacterales bacterium]